MRNIKFRAWYKGEKYPIFDGELQSYEKPRMIYDIQYIYDGSGADDDADGVGHISCFGSFLDDQDYVVEQWTGLRDAKDNEIYEGDIIKFFDFWDELSGGNKEGNTRIGCVEYVGSGFLVSDIEDVEYESDLYMLQVNDIELEVIGNIYENADYLLR